MQRVPSGPHIDQVGPGHVVVGVVEDLQERIDALPPAAGHRKTFIQTYLRTTEAVGRALDAASFEDPAWVVGWDVAFADLFLAAHDADRRRAGTEPSGPLGSGSTPDGQDAGRADHKVPRPWRLAFGADEGLPEVVHLLLGMNAHINFDLPQAVLAVISDADFDDPVLIDRRRRDHERIDQVLAGQVSVEHRSVGGRRSLIDRLLTPANRMSSRHFLREARQKVWFNVFELQRARVEGPDAYAERLAELEVLSAAKVADLMAPGQVLLRLAAIGFGVTLPPR